MTNETKIKEPKNPLDELATQAEILGAETAQGKNVDGDGEEVGEAVPVLTNEQTLSGAIGAAREAFCFFTKLDSPRRVLDDSAVQQLAALWAPVLDKHGIKLAEYMGNYGPEIAAAIGTFSIVSTLRAAVVAELATKQATKKADTVDTVDTLASEDHQQ